MKRTCLRLLTLLSFFQFSGIQNGYTYQLAAASLPDVQASARLATGLALRAVAVSALDLSGHSRLAVADLALRIQGWARSLKSVPLRCGRAGSRILAQAARRDLQSSARAGSWLMQRADYVFQGRKEFWKQARWNGLDSAGAGHGAGAAVPMDWARETAQPAGLAWLGIRAAWIEKFFCGAQYQRSGSEGAANFNEAVQ